MPITETASVEQTSAALGLRPGTVRAMVKAGRLSAIKVGRSWRVHAASINALLGNPATATQPDATPSKSDVFTADDADYLGIADRLRCSYIPEHAKLGAWIIAKHKQFGGSQVPNPEHFNPNTAFARSW